jgi:hypothetical protein
MTGDSQDKELLRCVALLVAAQGSLITLTTAEKAELTKVLGHTFT